MEKGSGIVNPSKYGYNIGDRIKTVSGGHVTDTELKYDHIASRGDEGVITGVDGKYTEIWYDIERFGVRYEHSREENFYITQRSNNEIESINTDPTYEIY